MAWRLASELTELAQIFGGETVSSEVEHGVLQGASVTVGKDEAIAVVPLGIGGAVFHDLGPEEMGHRSAAHRGARVARVGRLGLVGANGADGVDTFQLHFRPGIGRVLNLRAFGERSFGAAHVWIVSC